MALQTQYSSETQKEDEGTSYSKLQQEFIAEVRTQLGELSTEISERNGSITERDQYIYGDLLERALDIPEGHDKTPVNWLRRTVEIHKIQFMGRPFQVISTYDTRDSSMAAGNQEELDRLNLENKKQKEYAELRKNTIDNIIRDNGGHALFMDGAESASAVGSFIIKAFYDEESKKYVLSPIEAVENCYAIWSQDDFREFQAFGYVFQVSRQTAYDKYDCGANVQTSVQGQPLQFVAGNTVSPNQTGQRMVTVMEITGKITGWGTDKKKLVRVKPGKENEMNVVIVGDEIKGLVDEDKKLPRHYIFPNKKQRRRAWGVSDVSDSAIYLNATYIETLSDWRTVANKVNFPKFRGFNFGPDTQMPKFKNRRVQFIPLAEGQDIQPLNLGDSNSVEFQAQMDELKEQFVRETGISRVLFDDPSVTLNSNQALLTSMKPTSDIAESKKQLWGPILEQMFTDAILVVGEYDKTVKELADMDMPWTLTTQWPSIMQKEDPVYQQMLLNRKNAGTMSIQSYLEAQGESKEELDRIREEMQDPITAAIHGNQLALIATQLIAPPPPPTDEKPKVSVSLRGDLTPMQEAEIAQQAGFNTSGEMGPQGAAGNAAYSNEDNKGFIEGNAFAGGTAITQQLPQTNGQTATVANNQPGTGVVSQPGSGATTTSPEGALAQANQAQGA